ncbi:MAG TPA: TIGR03087 family PEP-CTERM/XrtA system glycosyltransferase [Planctomycetes bacterium]|nr:TIGR03087 family PEP-CTERM/XrtA system glycosyltransferase [Planctomycetota bacterium]
MNILFLSQRVPFPPNRGDKITTWRLIERMARDHRVRVVAFEHDEGDRDAARELARRGFEIATFRPKSKLASLPGLLGRRPMTLNVFGSAALQAQVDRWIADTDLAYAYSSSMGAFFLRHDVPRVMHFAELDSDKWRQYAERTRFPMRWVYAREARTLRAFEVELAHAVDENIFCTPLEEEIFQREIPGAPSSVLRNGVDLDAYRPAPEEAEPAHLVFVGVMNYYPNVDGCRWFCEEIFPRVRERAPQARFSIVGAHPTPEVQELGRMDGVEVTGFVDDPSDWLRRASISVAPLRIARGIQNKVLEALAMGLPVVGTTSATQGVEGRPGRDFLLADSAEEQAEAILGLIERPDEARALGDRGRAFVEERYDWEACLAPLDTLLSRIAARA